MSITYIDGAACCTVRWETGEITLDFEKWLPAPVDKVIAIFKLMEADIDVDYSDVREYLVFRCDDYAKELQNEIIRKRIDNKIKNQKKISGLRRAVKLFQQYINLFDVYAKR